MQSSALVLICTRLPVPGGTAGAFEATDLSSVAPVEHHPGAGICDTTRGNVDVDQPGVHIGHDVVLFGVGIEHSADRLVRTAKNTGRIGSPDFSDRLVERRTRQHRHESTGNAMASA